MTSFSFRRDIITKPIFSWARGVLPTMSDTEREALEAGDVWWDADLFTGNPDWAKLLATAPATLTAEEEAFLNEPATVFNAAHEQVLWPFDHFAIYLHQVGSFKCFESKIVVAKVAVIKNRFIQLGCMLFYYFPRLF